MRYLYYTINPRERLFKQLAGFLYYLRLADIKNYTLVLPKFELNNSYYYYEDLFDISKINQNINVISSDDYNKSMLGNTEFHLNVFNQLPITFADYNKYRNQVYYSQNYYKIFEQLKKYSFSINKPSLPTALIRIEFQPAPPTSNPFIPNTSVLTIPMLIPVALSPILVVPLK